MTATLYTDGGARGNPGPAGIGYVLTITGKPVIKKGEFIGKTTNNQAEYTALEKGLLRAQQEGVRELKCFLDSELVVKQLNGQYRVRDADLKPRYAQVSEIADSFTKISFAHVRREKNKQADMLVNRVLDKNTPR